MRMLSLKKKDKSWSQKGQILLIVVLVIIVASTVVLSLVSRTITSIRTSTEEIESQKALSAAEAGIERAIKKNILTESDNFNDVLPNNTSYSTDIKTIGSSNFILNGGNTIVKNEGVDIWFVNRNNVTGELDYSSSPSSLPSINLFWGYESDACDTSSNPAAIETIFITRDRVTEQIKSYRYVYDSCLTRRTENNFAFSDEGRYPKDYDGDGKIDVTFTNRTVASGLNSDLALGISDVVFARIIPIYKNTVIAVEGCENSSEGYSCPVQGNSICVTGKSSSATRKICTFKGHPQTFLPYIAYGLFVAGNF
jgi:hypothetical protein